MKKPTFAKVMASKSEKNELSLELNKLIIIKNTSISNLNKLLKNASYVFAAGKRLSQKKKIKITLPFYFWYAELRRISF